MDLSTASIIEKNRQNTDGVWLLLLEINYKDEDPVRLVANNENITFQGNLYYAYSFNVTTIKRSSTELPSVQLSVSNITGAIQAILEQYNGIGGAKVTLKAICTNVPDEIMDEEQFEVTGVTADRENVTLTLGTVFSLSQRFPRVRMLNDFCPFKFKGKYCGYKGTATTCDKTLVCCRKLNNSQRYGGEPTIPSGGLYVRK